MYVIGLTGGIATGKSTAAQTLRDLGADVIDADAISRALTQPGGDAAPAIIARFGTLDRRTLGRIVFSDPAARQALNSIVHPMVQARMQAELEASAAPVVVLDVPLLFESGMEGMADEVWVTHVPRGEQIARIIRRDGLTEAEAIARIESQMPTERKLAHADAGIDTGGPLSQTQARIEALYAQALRKAALRDTSFAPPPRRRTQARRQLEEQREVQAPPPVPLRAPVPEQSPDPDGHWEDTSTVLDMPEQRSFFARQSPIFWVAVSALLLALFLVVGYIGGNAWREYKAEREEERRLQQIAEEKARYKFTYRDLIEQFAAERELDPAFVAAVIYNESRFDPQAVSYLNARGLMQIMEDTGGWIAEMTGELSTYSFDLMFDPEANIRYGTWYLAFLYRMFDGDYRVMAAAYHAGQGAVSKWLENADFSADGETLDQIPYDDTRQYVQKVEDSYEIYKRLYYAPEPTGSV